ncbi:hypothetical protein [Nocardia sp. NPDC004415]
MVQRQDEKGSPKKLQNEWTVDHISYVRKPVPSIHEGHSNGIWLTGAGLEQLSNYFELFTASPGSKSDLRVFSQWLMRRQRTSAQVRQGEGTSSTS